jgi:hypothetical protein
MAEQTPPGEGLVIDIDFSGIDEEIKNLEDFPEILEAELTPTMELALQLVEAEVKYRMSAPEDVNTGVAAGSLNHQIISRFPDLVGAMGSPLIYVPVLEFGRAPGEETTDAQGRKHWTTMPPIFAIKLWVRRKLGLTGKESASAAWAIAKHIAKHGTEGRFMFKEGLEASQPNVVDLFNQAVARAVAKAGKPKAGELS